MRQLASPQVKCLQDDAEFENLHCNCSSALLLVIGGRLTIVESVPAADRISSECWELDWHTDREARGESPGWQHDNVDVLRLGDVHRVVVVC